jgi:hypothetical protein
MYGGFGFISWNWGVTVFLREHLAGGSLLRLIPHPADPAANSAPPRSSSPTTSPAASAPHRCLLHISTWVTVEAPPPVSTPFPGFPVAACGLMSSDHFPSTCLGFPPSLSRQGACHHACSSYGRARWLRTAGVGQPKVEGLGQDLGQGS